MFHNDGHDSVEPFACFAALGSELRGIPEIFQPAQDGSRIFKSGLFQCIAVVFRIRCTPPYGIEFCKDLLLETLCAFVAQQAVEMTVNRLHVRLKAFFETGPVVKPHGGGQPDFSQNISGKGVDLTVGEFLKSVLGVSQECVGLQQLPAHIRTHMPFPDQMLKNPINALLLKPGANAAADELKNLSEKLDFPNAAGAELDIVLHAFSLDFQRDFFFHLPKRFKSPEVQVAPVDKGFEAFEKPRAGDLVSGGHPRLDQGVTFPFPSHGLVIFFHVVKAHYQSAVLSVRPQSHVHTENKAVGILGPDQIDQPPAEPGEKFFIFDAHRAVSGLTGLRVGEYQIDVRRKVQLPGSQFSHSNDHQLLGIAAGVSRLAVGTAESFVTDGKGLIQALIRQFRQTGGRLIQISPAGQIPPGDANHLSLPEPSQGCGQAFFI